MLIFQIATWQSSSAAAQAFASNKAGNPLQPVPGLGDGGTSGVRGSPNAPSNGVQVLFVKGSDLVQLAYEGPNSGLKQQTVVGLAKKVASEL